MCGIAAAFNVPGAASVVRDGLRRLEHRGYDSAGIAWLEGGVLDVIKDVGRVHELPDAAPGTEQAALGHTRWATHGPVEPRNAHPHTDATGRFAVVHNGTLDDAAQLRRRLEREGTTIRSDTDSECIVHLYAGFRRTQEPLEALRSTRDAISGPYAFAILDAQAQCIVFVRDGAPLVVAEADGAFLLASDVTALLGEVDEVTYLDEGDHGIVHAGGHQLFEGDGRRRPTLPSPIDWRVEEAERSGHAHYMTKEIHETPAALNRALGDRLDRLDDTAREALAPAKRVVLVGCGSSLQAATVGAHLFEEWAHVPATAISASRLAARPLLEPMDTLYVLLSQSGETRDVLRCAQRLTAKGHPVLAITNVRGSTLERGVPSMLLEVGPEVAVAATKTYAAQIACLGVLAVHAGIGNRRLAPKQATAAREALERLPRHAEAVLRREHEFAGMGRAIARARSAFTLGRGVHAATAGEAALKLKEIAYIHAEAFDAAEMKHGPQALLQDDTPCLFFLGDDEEAQTTIHNLMEVRARGAPVHVIRTRHPRGDVELDAVADSVIELDAPPGPLAAVVHALAAQLLAYKVALGLGREIDRPRHLAKSVTVD